MAEWLRSLLHSNLERHRIMADKSMHGHTKESLDRKGQEDARNDSYNPPWGWFPGPEPVGREARDRYDGSFSHHKEQLRSKK